MPASGTWVQPTRDEILTKVRNIIVNQPQRHYQGSWLSSAFGESLAPVDIPIGELRPSLCTPITMPIRKVADDGDPKGNACGTRGCAAGLIVLVGSDPDEEFTDTSHVTVNGRTNRMSVSDRATQLAELSYEQREWLFSAIRSRDEVVQALDALIADPDAAVWEIVGAADEDEDDGEEIPVPFTVQIIDASGAVVCEHGVMSPASETYDELILRLGEDL